MADIVANSTQWTDCLRYMQRRMKEQSFNIWMKNTKGEPNGNGEFKLSVPNQFVADWINGHFRETIDEAFQEVLGTQVSIWCSLWDRSWTPRIRWRWSLKLLPQVLQLLGRRTSII